MRRSATLVAALAASAMLVLGGCSDDTTPEPAAGSPEVSSSPEESMSSQPEETTAPAALDDFPEVDGYTYQKLPAAALNAFDAAVKDTPQVGKAAGQLVLKDGEQAGLIMRISIDPDAANTPGFEDGFLPGFAGGIAGSDVEPDYEEINGTKVVKVSAQSAGGTAYAWIKDSVATVLVFQSDADAQAFAEGALA
jgi:hypothetical protein